MNNQENQPVVTQQTLARMSGRELLDRFKVAEIMFADQRDADQWDEVKKSLLIESVLN